MSENPGPQEVLFEQFARVGKALGSPKRLELLDVLAQGERSVEVLARRTGLKLTTASAHLQALRQGGLVRTRKEGTRVFYRLAGDEVARLCLSLHEVAKAHLAETRQAAHELLGEDEVEELGRDALMDRIEAGDALVLDVRPENEFEAGHIAGAVSVPLDELEDRLSELPADQEVVAYCRGEFCVLSYKAVRLLRARGRKARRMSGGMLEWRSEGRAIAA
ncbi:ArsR/SmtB family transcription factor [Amycolatopsis sp. VS8301801F10]|uniref:ArsR/SmtB family transcription factor n=1 Tax=Amycolatopsis sp. VS8301801F10 TaxID=2652442 RepID=UPI0038FCA338